MEKHRLRGLTALDGRDGPALALSEAELKAHVASLLERAGLVGTPPPAGAARPAPRPAPPAWPGERSDEPARVGSRQRSRGWRRGPVIAIAFVATTSAAAAAHYAGDRVADWLRSTLGAQPVEPSGTSAERAVAAPRPHAPAVAPRAAEDAPLSLPELAASERPEPERARDLPAAPEPDAPAAVRRRRAPQAKAPPHAHLTTRASPSAAAPPPAVAPAPSEARAVDLLGRANTARGARRFTQALDAYSRVVELYPDSLQAQAARVAAAALWLERFHDTQAAERLYTGALARGGELAVEARFGLAEVYRARGDASREREVLNQLGRAHPQHPLAAAARARLRELQP